MSEHIPPIESANIRYAEAAIVEQRVKERKRRDRWGRWFERVVLLVLVLLYLFGFGQTAGKEAVARNKVLSERVSIEAARTTRESRRTTLALCVLRHDLEKRVKDGNDFLATHPQGFPGVSAAQIRTSIDGQQRTVDALQILQCK